MGQANNKPRQLSMDAEADDSIDVSNDVVKRLKTGLKGKNNKSSVEKSLNCSSSSVQKIKRPSKPLRTIRNEHL
jgi:hypothetical protein